MKVVILSAVVLLAVGAHCWSLYGEKEEAIQAVNDKYEEVFKLIDKVAKDIENEKKKEENETVATTKAEGNDKRNSTEILFQRDIIETVRSAIARGKPLATIECIVKIKEEGEKAIIGMQRDFEKAVDAIKPNKEKGLVLANSELNLVKIASQGLKAESVQKILTAATGFPALKADALRKATNAEKQVHEIERRVPKPVLKEEYLLAKQQIGDRYKELRENFYRRLQKCIS